MHLHELAGREIVVDERLGLLVIGREAASITSGVSSARPSSWARLVSRSRATSSSSSSRRMMSRGRSISRARVERLGLRDVAGEAVEHEAVCSRLTSCSRIRAVVSSSGTSVPQSRSGFTCGRAAVRRDRCRKQVACRDVRERRTPQRSASPACPSPPPAARGSGYSARGILRSGASSSGIPSVASCRARRRRRSAPRCRRAHGPSPARSRSIDEEHGAIATDREEQRPGQRQPLRTRSRYAAVGGRAGCPGCSRRTCAGCRPGRPG